MLLLVSAAAAAMLSQAAPANDAKPAQDPPAAVVVAAAPEAKPRKTNRVCRAEPVLGSRLPVTLCATSAEWEARKQDDKEKTDEIQRRTRNLVPEG